MYYRNPQLGKVGRDSSVDTATHYGLDGPGIEFRWWRDFPHPSIPEQGPHLASYTMGTGSLPGGKAAGIDYTPHLAFLLTHSMEQNSS